MNYLKVNYKILKSLYFIKKELQTIPENKIISFDIETQSIYSKQDKEEAKEYLKNDENNEYKDDALKVINSSGLSHPYITKVTHFIIGLSKTESIIIINTDKDIESYVWNWLVTINNKIVIHNSLFDLKHLFFKKGKLPKNFIDTYIYALTLINHTSSFKRQAGLKTLVGSYYPPEWSIYENYEVDNYEDKSFLEYCAIDGAATLLLYELLEKERVKNGRF